MSTSTVPVAQPAPAAPVPDKVQSPSLPAAGRVLPWSPRVWRATASAALAMVYGLVVGGTLLGLLSTGVSLLVVLVGILFIAITPVLGRGGAMAYRFKQEAVLGSVIPGRPWPSTSDPSWGSWQRAWRVLSNPGLWLETLHAILMLILGPIWFGLVSVSWTLALAAVAFPFYASSIPGTPPLVEGLGFDYRELGPSIAIGLVGLVGLFVAAWFAELGARADDALARGMLAPSEAEILRSRVSTLQTTREAAVRSADDERRRIERDLHDGVQPQLVSLAMNLGRAQRKLDTDPAGARVLVDEAHEQAKQAIVELRHIIRGVHPAVLSERGLDPALSALAARSPVPVWVQVDPTVSASRFDPAVEAVAYFCVAEALTNVARHAGATRARVIVWQLPADTSAPRRLLLCVQDDGRGGAVARPGSGLSGLEGRIVAVDGRLWVQSPAGQGTTITVELPCAS